MDKQEKEKQMANRIETSKGTQIDAGYETSKFALGVGITMAALVGLWGAASLVSALAGAGPINLIKSYFTAVLG